MAPDQRAPSDSPSVVLELSHAQISEVTRSIGGTGTVPGLLSRLSALREALESVESSKRLSESLISGLFLLACFPEDGTYTRNSELASRAGMSVSNAHRYISTLVAAGLVERHPETRKCRLAPSAVDATPTGPLSAKLRA